jgi:ABC-type spermidine/putrescine transport system permease subunit I
MAQLVHPIKDSPIPGSRWQDAAGVTLAIPALLLVLILFLWPFVKSIMTSFVHDGQLSLNNYRTAFRLYSGDMLYTLGISLGALAILLLLAVALGGYLRIHQNKFIEFIFKIPLFVPFVVAGHAMRVFLAPKGILNSLLASAGMINIEDPPSIAYSAAGIIAALVWKNISFALLLIIGAYRGIDESYLEAARNFGASSFRQIKDVLLPMALPSVIIAAILLFTSLMASFSIPMMIGKGEGAQMIMVDVYYRIVYLNDYGVANALGVVSYVAATAAAIYYMRGVTRS